MVKNAASWTYVVIDLNAEETIETFYENKSKIKENNRIEQKIQEKR